MEPTKICKKCGQEKPLADFHAHTSTRDRHRSECASCTIERVQEWKRNNPDKVRANVDKHRDKRRQAAKRWRELNPEKVALQKQRAKERRRKKRPEGGNG